MGEILSIHTCQSQRDYATSDDHLHNFIRDIPTGQIVCNLCGFVKETNIFVMDWKGTPYTKESTVRFASKSSQSVNSNLKRALKLNNNKTWEDRKQNIGVNEIKRLTALFGLGDFIISRSVYLFQKAVKQPKFKVHNVILTSQVCFFYSARMKNFPIALEEIILEQGSTTRLAYRYYYLLMSELNLPKPQNNPAPLIPKLCAGLGLDEFVTRKAMEILSTYVKYENTSGLNSVGIVAGVIYLTCLRERIPRSQQIIAKHAKISDITLRTRYKEIKKVCDRYW